VKESPPQAWFGRLAHYSHQTAMQVEVDKDIQRGIHTHKHKLLVKNLPLAIHSFLLCTLIFSFPHSKDNREMFQ